MLSIPPKPLSLKSKKLRPSHKPYVFINPEIDLETERSLRRKKRLQNRNCVQIKERSDSNHEINNIQRIAIQTYQNIIDKIDVQLDQELNEQEIKRLMHSLTQIKPSFE
jgi:hypothetical protein